MLFLSFYSCYLGQVLTAGAPRFVLLRHPSLCHALANRTPACDFTEGAVTLRISSSLLHQVGHCYSITAITLGCSNRLKQRELSFFPGPHLLHRFCTWLSRALSTQKHFVHRVSGFSATARKVKFILLKKRNHWRKSNPMKMSPFSLQGSHILNKARGRMQH